MLWQCEEGEKKDIRLITFQGSTVESYPDFRKRFTPLDSLGYGGIVVRNRGHISANDFYFSVRPDLPDTLRFRHSDSLMYLNGRLAAITISGNNIPQSFFRELSADEISHLRTIQILKPIADSIKPFLEKIAIQKPEIDLIYSSDVDSVGLTRRDLLWLSQHFRPGTLMIGNEAEFFPFSSIAKFPSLETLIIGVSIKEDSYLPPLPHLKEVVVFNTIDSTSSLGSEFFKNNPDLESLSIIGDEGKIDRASLDHLKRLKHLFVGSNLIGSTIYVNYPHLEFLEVFPGGEEGLTDGVYRKNKLKWLSLSAENSFKGQNPGVFQDSFPELEYLEFENYDSLFNYSNLKDLKNLKYLVVVDEAGLDSTLHNLDHLLYLSLPEEILKDSIKVVQLQKNLPQTVLTPNSGACLGSGWLLLIFPLAALSFYLLRFRKRRNQ